jgi:hypothetical protein
MKPLNAGTKVMITIQGKAVVVVQQAWVPSRTRMLAQKAFPRRARPDFASGLHAERQLGCECCPLHLDKDR